MPRVVKIGDIFEIKTSKGFAYGQKTHRNKLMGELIRILPGFFDETPKNFKGLALEKDTFKIFFPLGTAVNRKIARIVSNEEVPDFAKPFPIFRTGTVSQKTLKVGDNWWLWDGEKSWPVGKLTEEQKGFPVRESWNDTLLIKRIEESWNVRNCE